MLRERERKKKEGLAKGLHASVVLAYRELFSPALSLSLCGLNRSRNL